MEAAIHALDEAVTNYRQHGELGDVSEQLADALADAAEAVLNSWDFDRGIPRF